MTCLAGSAACRLLVLHATLCLISARALILSRGLADTYPQLAAFQPNALLLTFHPPPAGYLYCNMPVMNFTQGQIVRFHVMALGTEGEAQNGYIHVAMLLG